MMITVGLAFAYGNFGEFNQDIQAAANEPVQTYEAGLEFYYRIQLNKFLIVQPFIQYIIRPGGAGLVENATVLGIVFPRRLLMIALALDAISAGDYWKVERSWEPL